MTCSNCPNPADFLQADPWANDVAYCATCLPRSLAARAKAGELDLPATKPAHSKAAAKDAAPLA